MDTMSHKVNSFKRGYEAVVKGEIIAEMTKGEIMERYPGENPTTFQNGMLDALIGESWRYRRLILGE